VFRLALRAVFRLALRQAEGLIGSILQLLGLDLPVPNFSTLRACEFLPIGISNTLDVVPDGAAPPSM
jgi:hypothetical protein